VGLELGKTSDALEKVEKPGIEEVELGVLDYALARVFVLRLKEAYDHCALKNGNPATYGGVACCS
jgi:hypothetical protein